MRPGLRSIKPAKHAVVDGLDAALPILGIYTGRLSRPRPYSGLRTQRRDRSRPASAFKIQLYLCSVRCRKESQVQAKEEINKTSVELGNLHF